jgi:class 3 adenylate cyclase
LVVVGDLIGAGSAQEQSVVCETPNLAARLQTLAEPNAVVIAASTRRLVGDLFEYRGNAQKSLSQERDRWFESGSLQRRTPFGTVTSWRLSFHAEPEAALRCMCN